MVERAVPDPRASASISELGKALCGESELGFFWSISSVSHLSYRIANQQLFWFQIEICPDTSASVTWSGVSMSHSGLERMRLDNSIDHVNRGVRSLIVNT